MHCHQDQETTSSNVIFVAKDGVQSPPIIFENSKHLKQFLTCLENGLTPNYKIDPSSWESILDVTNFSIVLKINVLFLNNDEEDLISMDFNSNHPANCFELSPIGIANDQNKKRVSLEFNLFESNICTNR